LNSESRLEYPDSFKGTSREVRLEGEAYFVVAHNEAQPFLVHTGEVTTRVLGTQFNVSSYPGHEQVSIAVATGKVAVSNQNNLEEDGRQVILDANEWASYSTVTHSFSTGYGVILLHLLPGMKIYCFIMMKNSAK
jgi:ferric-dicitrate binding protein FerR (iron transport regulator)